MADLLSQDGVEVKEFTTDRTVVLVGLGDPCSRTFSWQIHLLITSALDLCLKT